MSQNALLSLDKCVSIAIASHGNVDTSYKCLDCLFRSVTGSFELLLVDDCSPDNGATLALFREAARFHENTKVFYFTENLEYTGSVNAVLSHMQGDIVFFLSNDILVTPQYFSMLLQAASSHPEAILRGSSNFVDNLQSTHNLSTGRQMQQLEDLLAESAFFAEHFGPAVLEDNFLVGDAFAVTRPVIEKIGTFDPLFYGYFGDLDYGLRSRIAGLPLLLVQGAYAYHSQDANLNYLSPELKKEKLARRWLRVSENWARFKLKYGLPVAMHLPNTPDVPWNELVLEPFLKSKHYSSPQDYSRFQIPNEVFESPSVAKESSAEGFQ
jgi:GT2 family glycosyltransferase